jgi:hypothetical protein
MPQNHLPDQKHKHSDWRNRYYDGGAAQRKPLHLMKPDRAHRNAPSVYWSTAYCV